ncbi:MAG: Holliday junction branch migration protein RuvA [Xanthobacter sp.]
MIGKLKGVVDLVREDHLILDVQGVGYLVHCSARTLESLPRGGEKVALFIETHVREDMIRLYGFASEAEQEWFRLLQGVQGVGAKTALAVLSTLRPADLSQAVALGDKAAISRAPGIGPRSATRIITELKDKAPATAMGTFVPAATSGGAAVGSGESGAIADAISALTNLGYALAQAHAAVAVASREAGEEAKAETLIRLGLKELAK